MKFALPRKFELPFGGATAGLVIRTGEVEILAMRGKAVTSRVRVAIDGKEDHRLVGAIQRALEAAGLKTKRLAVSLPSQDVLFRFFTVPTVPKTELDAVVQFEARKYIPFKTDTLIWDYRAAPAKDPTQLDIVFSAISRDLFTQLQGVFAGAGIQPTLMEPRSVSLARLIEPKMRAAADEFTCLVEIERDMAHIAIVKNQLPYLTRDIVFAADGAAPAAADPNAEPSQPAGVDPRGQRLLSELSVSMNFFLREYPSTTIPRILLFGEETVVGPWCHWLADQLHCAVEAGHACVEPRVDGGLPLSFAPALGLIEAAQRPAEIPINFLRRGTVKPVQRQAPAAGLQLSATDLLDALRTPAAVVSLVLAACALGGLWFMERLSVSTERDQLNQRIAARPDIGATLNAMGKEDVAALKQKAESQLAFLRQAIDQRLRVAAKLDAVARALPNGVWLTSLTFEDQMTPAGKSQFRMAIRGACFLGQADQELGAIHQFEAQVKGNPTFLAGFNIAQVDQIDAQTQTTPEQNNTYRAFQMNCNTGRAM